MLESRHNVLDTLKLSQFGHVLRMVAEIGQRAAGLLLHTSVLAMRLHGCDDHSQPALLCNGRLVRVIVRKVGKRQASEVLHACLIWPSVHRVDHHVDGARVKDDSAVVLLDSEIPKRTKAVRLDARVLSVRP